VIASCYIAARLTLHGLTVSRVEQTVSAERTMVAPHPLDPTRWDVLIQTREGYRYGQYSWLNRALMLEPDRIPLPVESPEWAAARNDPSIHGFMTWVRFPWYEIERSSNATRVYVYDARYARRRTGQGFGAAVVTLPAK
jgi:hypothetical protein